MSGSNNDAEWIDVNEEPELKPGPNRPPPRRRTPTAPSVTIRPRRPPWARRPNGRPRRPFRPGTRHDLPEMLPPSGSSGVDTTTISVSVAGALFMLVLCSLLLYLFVLKKKLRKVKRSQSDAQFSLRVEDVAHLDMNDSSMYMNTTDLQRLVSSIRIKDKKLPPPLPSNEKSDLFSLNKHSLPKQLPEEPSNVYDNPYMDSPTTKLNRPMKEPPTVKLMNNKMDRASPYENVEIPDSELQKAHYSSIQRPSLPPPPTPKRSVEVNQEATIQGNFTAPKIPNLPISNPMNTPKIPEFPFALNQIQDNIPKSNGLESVKPSEYKIECPKFPKDQKPELPSNPKPNIFGRNTSTKRPMLPRLKMNMVPLVSEGDSTPGTACTYVTDSDTPTSNTPEVLSVKQKRAILENALL